MGMASAAVQVGQTAGDNSSGGKGQSVAPQPIQQPAQQQAIKTNWGGAPEPMGKGGYTSSATSGQPRVGQANKYSNTVGVSDNTQQQTQLPQFAGKSKGA